MRVLLCSGILLVFLAACAAHEPPVPNKPLKAYDGAVRPSTEIAELRCVQGSGLNGCRSIEDVSKKKTTRLWIGNEDNRTGYYDPIYLEPGRYLLEIPTLGGRDGGITARDYSSIQTPRFQKMFIQLETGHVYQVVHKEGSEHRIFGRLHVPITITVMDLNTGQAIASKKVDIPLNYRRRYR